MSTTLTPFGLAVRELRLRTGEKIIDMARELNKSSAYISAVETGRKNLTTRYLDEVISYFGHKGIDASHLRDTLAESQNEFRINLAGQSSESRQLAAAFARKFPSLSEEQKKNLMKLLANPVEPTRAVK